VGDVVAEDVVSARWICRCLSRDKEAWQSGVDASGHYELWRRCWSNFVVEVTVLGGDCFSQRPMKM
jgi:hypothetical protein